MLVVIYFVFYHTEDSYITARMNKLVNKVMHILKPLTN